VNRGSDFDLDGCLGVVFMTAIGLFLVVKLVKWMWYF
jgi:hypothetical protein